MRAVIRNITTLLSCMYLTVSCVVSSCICLVQQCKRVPKEERTL